MDDLLKEISDLRLDPKKRARKIIELYMSNSDSMPEELRDRFFAWLVTDRDMDIKDEVLMEIFDREVRFDEDGDGCGQFDESALEHEFSS